MSTRIRWSEIERHVGLLGKPALLELLKELYETSPDTQAFLAARFLSADT